jgi:Helix-turn-helix family
VTDERREGRWQMSEAIGDPAMPMARKTWRTLEPLHGMIYFVPEATEAYARLGVTGRAGYFASRAAPMGAVTAEVVSSTFFNFNPELVHEAIPAAWEAAAPADLVAARFGAVDAAFRRVLGDAVLGSAEMHRAAVLARSAAEVAAQRCGGRPLAAGHAEVAWPLQPHLVLWNASSVLREYRGDAHVALLVAHGLSGLEALVTHATAGDVPAEVLRVTRGWSQEEWGAAAEALRSRGWLERDDELRFTEWGAGQRRAIEAGTDALSAAPYDAPGEEACAELRTLARPWSSAFADLMR